MFKIARCDSTTSYKYYSLQILKKSRLYLFVDGKYTTNIFALKNLIILFFTKNTRYLNNIAKVPYNLLCPIVHHSVTLWGKSNFLGCF